jgi:HAD superfamily hydrolase (TIGR01509 family)
MPPNLVIFDCDGVLVDSETLSNRVMRDSLDTHGLNLSLKVCMDTFVGGTISGVYDTARDMGATLPDTWVADIYEEIYRVLADQVEMVPNLTVALDALASTGTPYCVASNGSMEKMTITLGRTGLIDRFKDRMFSARNVDHPKPAPDLFLSAANHFNFNPQTCLVIEDSVAGVMAAMNAKMPCLGFTSETAPEKLAPYCNATFDDMIQLSHLIQSQAYKSPNLQNQSSNQE